jgi:hypothetical protein
LLCTLATTASSDADRLFLHPRTWVVWIAHSQEGTEPPLDTAKCSTGLDTDPQKEMQTGGTEPPPYPPTAHSHESQPSHRRLLDNMQSAAASTPTHPLDPAYDPALLFAGAGSFPAAKSACQNFLALWLLASVVRQSVILVASRGRRRRWLILPPAAVPQPDWPPLRGCHRRPHLATVDRSTERVQPAAGTNRRLTTSGWAPAYCSIICRQSSAPAAAAAPRGRGSSSRRWRSVPCAAPRGQRFLAAHTASGECGRSAAAVRARGQRSHLGCR